MCTLVDDVIDAVSDVALGKKVCWRSEVFMKNSSAEHPSLTRRNLGWSMGFGGFSDGQLDVLSDKLTAHFRLDSFIKNDFAIKVLLPETMSLIVQAVFKVDSETADKYLYFEA